MLTHGLYRSAKVDMRTRAGLAFKEIFKLLLERFPTPAPAGAQIIAQRCAVKVLRAVSFEIFYLAGNTTAPGADRDYLALTGSIRSDIKLLHEMAQTPDPAARPPSLEEYLRHLKERQEHEEQDTDEPA